MPSHLTRSVFRRLLSNEGLILRCPNRSAALYRYRNVSPSPIHASPRRTLFGFSLKPPRQPKDPELDPGLSKMLELNNMEKIQARPPPPDGLVVAFNTFFAYKLKAKEAINNIQAQHALRTFRYLQRTNTDLPGFGLTVPKLRDAILALTKMPNDKTNTHNELARELYAEICRRKPLDVQTKSDLEHFLEILTSTGDSADARDYLERASSATPTTEVHKSGLKKLWLIILNGFAKENNETELLKSAERAETAGLRYSFKFHEFMTTFYASQNNIVETKFWFNKDSAIRLTGVHKVHQAPTPETMSSMLRFCLRNNEVDWCRSIFRDLLDLPLVKGHWDVIFQWASGALGKGVEDVERMMGVMIARYPDNKLMRPDSETINGLVDLAMSLKDPYLAERYITLGLKSGIRPNAKTFALQMEYRIGAGDLTGTQVAYEALQGEEIIDNEDLPVVNKYIRALCSSNANNYDRIVSIITDLDERNARLEADTVSALCTMYLRRGDLPDVVDILQINTFHHTLDERTRVRDSLLAFCLDRSNDTARVWDTYTIFRDIFQETDRGVRTQMMNEFFARNRSDMACHVFGHMRQHDRKEVRPLCETYVECFEGIAKGSDRESLDMVHNMLKLDFSIEPTTRLYNSLMLAYTACDDAYRALDFWSDITNSREGPSYNSLEIVFLACAKRPFGDKTARGIWSKMRRMEIEVTPAVFAAFGAALAGQGKLDEVKNLIEGMEKEVGYGPDVLTIGTFYNYTKGQNRKDLIEEWAKDMYPNIWTELEKLGQRIDENEWRYFNIVREVRA